jgi:inorganic triphosphatase YgiF
MSAILALLARPFVQMAVSAFGQVLLDLLSGWRSHEDAIARGRADAERAALIAIEAARSRMEGVGELSDDEMLKRLREGKA